MDKAKKGFKKTPINSIQIDISWLKNRNLNTAFVGAYLLNLHKICLENNDNQNEGIWFVTSSVDIASILNISIGTSKSILIKFIEIGLIERKRVKNNYFFRVNEKQLLSFLQRKSKSKTHG